MLAALPGNDMAMRALETNLVWPSVCNLDQPNIHGNGKDTGIVITFFRRSHVVWKTYRMGLSSGWIGDSVSSMMVNVFLISSSAATGSVLRWPSSNSVGIITIVSNFTQFISDMSFTYGRQTRIPVDDLSAFKSTQKLKLMEMQQTQWFQSTIIRSASSSQCGAQVEARKQRSTFEFLAAHFSSACMTLGEWN